jgi:hypothetical protein
MKGQEIKTKDDAALKLVVRELVKTQGGLEVLRFFVHDGMGASYTTDPVFNAYLEGRRSYGRKIFKILTSEHNHLIQDVLGNETTN